MKATKNTCAKLYAGYGRVCITPDFPTKLAGYADLRIHKSVTDDIYASCTALRDNNGNTVLLFSIEVLGIDGKHSKILREYISEQTGVEYKNIFLNATHCHTAPFEYQMVEIHKTQFTKAAKEAIADLCECEAYAGLQSVEGLVFVRRYICEDGSFGYGTPENPIYAHESKADEIMPVIRFTREGKKDIILSNYAGHSDTVAYFQDYYTISADFVGVVRNLIEAKYDAYVSIQMGAAGDVVPFSRLKNEPRWKPKEEFGAQLAQRIEESLENLKKVDISEGIRVTSCDHQGVINHTQDYLLPKTREAWAENQKGNKDRVKEILAEIGLPSAEICGSVNMRGELPEFYTFELSTLAIGDIAICFAPYEMFTQTSMRIKKASKFGTTLICSLTNGEVGYIPTKLGFSHGGYETNSTWFLPGTAEDIEEILKKQLAELYIEKEEDNK